MTGMLSDYAPAFLKAFSVLTLIVFAIPIALAPMAWARVFQWEIDSRPHLALYFGRCLGAVAMVLSVAAWYAADHAEIRRFYFFIYLGVTSLIGIVHVVGAVQKVQPWTESAEIAFWFGLFVLGVLFIPAAP
jgi:hypothetical protein